MKTFQVIRGFMQGMFGVALSVFGAVFGAALTFDYPIIGLSIMAFSLTVGPWIIRRATGRKPEGQD